MAEDYQEEHKKKTARIRSFMDFAMGIIFFLVGCFFIAYGWLDIKVLGKKHDALDYLIGGLFVLYGVWRVYRGYKKEYYR